MVKGYLEQRLTTSLERNKIIANDRVPIVYRPEEQGYGYKRFISSALRHAPTIGMTGIGIAAVGAAGALYYDKEILARNLAAGIGVASGVGLAFRAFKPLHNWLRSDPEDIAERYFLSVDVPWREAYDNLTIDSKRELDGYVLLAQTADKIAHDRVHHDTQLALGIAIAKTADILSGLSYDSKLSGLTLKETIEMLVRQKVGTETDSMLITNLRQRYSSGRLAKFIRDVDKRKIDVNSIPGLPVLFEHLTNYEYILRTASCGSLESMGSQLSRGELMLTNDAGPNAGSYAGMHSKGKDFPRLKIKDNADHSLGTHASRLLAVVGGNVGQGAFEEATGVVGIVEGTAGHHFCHKADDTTWPMIGITVGGLSQRLDEVQNGLVVSLCQDKLLRNSGEKPCVYVYSEGRKEKIDLPMGENDELHHEAPETLKAMDIAEQYINSWAKKRRVA